MTTAEPLLDFHRAEIESAFGCKSYTQYGCREVWAIGAECEHGTPHINEDINYVELERPGHAGPILLTPLFNYAMPLIRYDVEETGLNAGDRESLLEGLRSATAGAAARYQNQFTVSVELTDHIEPSASGKHRYCLSLVAAPATAAWPAEKTV